MALVEEFETLLKDVVSAKRLSASKMTKLTEIAMKNMEHDTKLVSILYRTHKSLPTASKISSLYVFDALSRAARHHATKHGTTGDINSPTGNSATFLLKIEGILEGLFQDMMTADELKDKTKKILDIWVKGNTFPSAILTRLTEIMDGKEKEPEMKPKPMLTADPRMAAQPPAPAPPVPSASLQTPASDAQAMLLALLAQAANSSVAPVQINANTPSHQASHLAVLQQLNLARANNSSQSHPPSLPHSSTVSTVPDSASRPDNIHHEQKQDERPHYEESHQDRSIGSRGGSRGRGRGTWRGNEGRGRWDERDRNQPRAQSDWSPSRRRRSRSRSPGRPGSAREPRRHSPRRDSWGNMSPNSRDTDSTKDEFGRDLRPQSPSRNTTPPTTVDPRRPPLKADSQREDKHKPIPGPVSNHDCMSLTPSVAANTSSGVVQSSAPIISSVVLPSSGLENFDPTTFDFTSPASWEALGKMWQVTNGYVPATEELAQFVFTAQAAMVDPSIQQQSYQGWSNNTMPSGWGETGRGRGGFDNGNGQGGHNEWSYDDSSHSTDAIVVDSNSINGANEYMAEGIGMRINHSQSGSGGRMQKVGDKWVFVRDQ